ncbi:hypothetical protein [uncultured Microbacterium sp.]|uniref:hypothetical protein n=1 Tax=uncultured Microbacterium sp. TaxID=191216 RepID=UPI00260539FF|nr:hypothetical protein [uncultured Microbacterium sp.]
MSARLILAAESVASWIDSYRDDRHLTTDPACEHYRAPRLGSRLDRRSRGTSCVPCMCQAAFGDMACWYERNPRRRPPFDPESGDPS